MQGAKALEESAPEQPREDAHGQEEARSRSDPRCPSRDGPPPGDDAMQVRMMGHRRAPGVQHRGDPESSVETLGIAPMVSSVSAAALNSRSYTSALF